MREPRQAAWSLWLAGDNGLRRGFDRDEPKFRRRRRDAPAALEREVAEYEGLGLERLLDPVGFELR